MVDLQLINPYCFVIKSLFSNRWFTIIYLTNDSGPAMRSAHSMDRRGWIPSGPHDLLTFKFLSFFSTIAPVSW